MLDTPVLLIIFNRPALTRKVFESIRKVRPQSLYVAADGPRSGRADDQELCRRSRAVIDSVDWTCEVRKKYSAVNLGCGVGPASAITWFFDNVDQGIILEDDCLPNDTFFVFCREMLNYYKDDPRIMHVSGSNFQFGQTYGEGSYFFSAYPLCTGWATWCRAWKLYKFDLIPEVYRSHQWDTQWVMTIEIHKGLAITPNANLVSNIGYGPDATHTRGTSILANLPTSTLQFPLRHPASIEADKAADRYVRYTRFCQLDTWPQIYRLMAFEKIRSILSPINRWLPKSVKRAARRLLVPGS